MNTERRPSPAVSFFVVACCAVLASPAGASRAEEATALLRFLPEAAARRGDRLPLSGSTDGFALPGNVAAADRVQVLKGRVPLLASGRFSFAGSGLSLTLEGAAPARATLGDREVRWADAYPAVDVSAFATGQFLELSYLLLDTRARRSFRWAVTLPARSSWRVEPGGRLLLERDGEALLAVPRPRAVDASGVELAVRVDVEREGLRFTLVGAPRAFPVLLDPVVEVPLWQVRINAEPLPRSRAAVAFDAARNVTVLFGGQSLAGVEGDTWRWDGVTWTQLSPATSPPPRTDAALVFDAQRNVLLLHGGRGTATWLTDTWAWDGVTWTLVANSVSFSGPAALAFDSDRRVVVANGRNGALSYTFEWNGLAWAARSTPNQPPHYEGHALAYDPQRQVMVLFGGNRGVGPENQTWELSSTDWTQRAPATVPGVRTGHAMHFDARRARLVMLGGTNGSLPYAEAWEWTGADWVAQAAPSLPARAGFGLSWDSARNRTVLVGGQELSLADDLWEQAGVGSPWARIEPAGAPLARGGQGMAYDSLRGVSVLVGGTRHGVPTPDTFEWNGVAWTRRASSLDGRAQHAVGFDAQRGVVVALGGGSALAQQGAAFGGTAWQDWPWNVGPVTDTVVAFDPSRGGLLAFSGRDATLNSYSGLYLSSDAGWTVLAPSGPDAMGAPAAAFDERRNTLVVWGSFRFSAPLQEWNGAWTALTRTPSPFGRANDALAWDADRGVSVLFGEGSADTWEWDGVAWAHPLPATRPPVDADPTLSFDRLRHRTVLQTSSGQTWEYSALRTGGSDCAEGWQCTSGFCVDGMCCDSACGGAALGDCQACSIAAGATSEGTCAPLGASVVCNASPGTCLLPSRCAPPQLSCPAPAADPTCAATDAGAPDAGAPDAGAADAGAPDAGAPDAGPADAGAADAGAPGENDGPEMDEAPSSRWVLGVGCGCTQGADPLSALLIGALLLLRRRASDDASARSPDLKVSKRKSEFLIRK